MERIIFLFWEALEKKASRRKICFSNYRYGFNGKEKDDKGEFGSQATYDYGFRIYNPGIGKFLSVDPLAKSYPWYTPYQYAGNKPIWAIDRDGLEDAIYTIVEDLNGNKKETLIDLPEVGKLGPGVIISSFGYHGNLNDPKESLDATLSLTQKLYQVFIPTVTLKGEGGKFDTALEGNLSLELGPNISARGRILGFGGGVEVGATGEVFNVTGQADAQLDDFRLDPNGGLQDPNLNFTLGGDFTVLSGTSNLRYSFNDLNPEIDNVEFTGAVSVLRATTNSSDKKIYSKVELASFAIGPGFFKIKGELSTTSFDLLKGGQIRKRFNKTDDQTVPADNVRVGSGNGF